MNDSAQSHIELSVDNKHSARKETYTLITRDDSYAEKYLIIIR